MGMGTPPFPLFSLGLVQASGNTGGMIKKTNAANPFHCGAYRLVSGAGWKVDRKFATCLSLIRQRGDGIQEMGIF